MGRIDGRALARTLARAAVIAALYVVLTLIPYPLSYGFMQVRISEAMCVLPLFTPVAIPGLFVGCLVSNLLGGNGIWDVVIGSLTTLAASGLTYALRNRSLWISISPAVVLNAIIIGVMLYALGFAPAAWMSIGGVGLGQLISCYGLGMPLALWLRRRTSLRRLLG